MGNMEQSHFEYDMFSAASRNEAGDGSLVADLAAPAAAPAGKAEPSSPEPGSVLGDEPMQEDRASAPAVLHDEPMQEEGDDGCGCDDEYCEEQGAAEEDEVNPFQEPPQEVAEEAATASSAAAAEEGASATGSPDLARTKSSEDLGGASVADASSRSPSPQAKRPRQRSRGPRAASVGASASASSRLEALAKPREVKEAPEEPFKPQVNPPKKPQASRPSTLLRLRPTNLQEARESFFASGFTEAPRFSYAYSEEVVTKHFEENNNVCFEMLSDAKRILQRVVDEYGGPAAYMQRLTGDEKISATELRDIVYEYLQEHNVEDKTEIRIVEGMLSAANVVKPGNDERYVVNLSADPCSKVQIQGICDHEVGTHLLRMMNDDHQVWHGRRERYKLANPWTTEEGFATLNTYQSMPVKLLYPQALKYWAVCRGAQVGFVELFQELSQHVPDPGKCWTMCCRIKRGMVDTSLPGAFYLDQAYFKGAVEILRHLDEVDFFRLYAGQIALQDLDKVHFLIRKEVVRFPRFLNSAEKLKAYLTHCRKLIKENQIEISSERVCKQVFIRTAKEFFKPKKESAQAPAADPSAAVSADTARNLDLTRLEDLAKPRQLQSGDTESPENPAKRRDLDMGRLTALAQPRSRAEAEEEAYARTKTRTLDLAHLESLSRPRQVPKASDDSDSASADRPKREASIARLSQLAMPRQLPTAVVTDTMDDARRTGSRGASAPAGSRMRGDEDFGDHPIISELDEQGVPPPPPPHERTVDAARLAELSAPRKLCAPDSACCPPIPKGGRRKRSTKCRLLALVKERKGLDGESTEDASVAPDGTEEGESMEEALKMTPRESRGLPVVEPMEDSLFDEMRAVLSPVRPPLPLAASAGAGGAAPVPLNAGIDCATTAPAAGSAASRAPPVKPMRRSIYRASSVGATARSSPLDEQFIFGSSKPRVPIGLPRGATAAASEGSAWKAVPIKTMQFGGF